VLVDRSPDHNNHDVCFGERRRIGGCPERPIGTNAFQHSRCTAFAERQLAVVDRFDNGVIDIEQGDVQSPAGKCDAKGQPDMPSPPMMTMGFKA
jgi:hypothetical protein